MIKNRYIPIRFRLLISYLILVIVAVFLLSIVFNYFYTNSMENEAVNNALKINGQMLNNLDYYMNDLLKVGINIESNSQIAELLKNNNEYLSDIVRIRYEYPLYLSFKDIIGYKNDVRSLILIAKNGRLFKFSEEALSVTENAINDDWYIKAVNSPESMFIEGPNYKSYYKENNDNKVFSLIMKLEGPSGTTWGKVKLGILRIDIDIQYFEKLYSMEYYGYSSNYRTTIFDGDLNIIYDTDKKNIGQKAGSNLEKDLQSITNGKFCEYYEGEKILNVVSTSQNTGCKVLHSIPYSDLLKDVKYIRLITIGVGIASIFITFIISVYLSYKITKPIKLLISRMKKMESSDLESWGRIDSKDEIGDLTNNFNQMTNKLNNLIKNEYALKIKEKEAEIRALQSQITPHFLYNTLETVRYIAVEREVEEIGIIAKSLAEMFRYSIKGKRISTIKKEIEYVKDYLYIQTIRNPGKLDTLIKIEDGLENCKVIKLLFQPFVENAIIHGLMGKEGGGVIAILIKRNNNQIEIKIIDNGKGFSKLELEKLNKLLSEIPKNYLEYNDNMPSLGILNVNSRIKLHYGHEYGLRYESQKGIGTTVYITIPAIYDGDDENETENSDC